MEDDYFQKVFRAIRIYFRIPRTENIGYGTVMRVAKEYGDDVIEIECISLNKNIYVSFKEVYLTEEEAIFALVQFKKNKKERYLKKINTLPDLLWFTYTHKTACAYNTDIDWEARDVIRQKSKELLGIDIGNI